MRRATVLAIVASLIAPAGALATPHAAQWNLPEQHAIAVPPGLEQVAVEYWSARGVPVPVNIELFTLPSTDDEGAPAAQGELNGPRVWIQRKFLEYARQGFYQADLCRLFVHERGHNAGLTHETPFPLMMPTGPDTTRVPRCHTWARRDSLAS